MAKYSPLQKSKFKFIYTFFGSIVGLAGVLMGVVLVLQPQLLNEKASTVRYTPMPSGICNLNNWRNFDDVTCGPTEMCKRGEMLQIAVGLPSGCPTNLRCIGSSKCGLVSPVPSSAPSLLGCDSGLSCTRNPYVSGTSPCLQNNLETGERKVFCCPPGKVIRNLGCVRANTP